MRRAILALATLLAPAAAAPAAAQWLGPPPWARPCFGPCRPFWGWARPVGVAPARRALWGGPTFPPARFGPGGIWGRPFWLRREMRQRRLAAWRRWAAPDRQAVARRPGFDGWAWSAPQARPIRSAPEIAASARLDPIWRAPARPAVAPDRAGPGFEPRAVAIAPAPPPRMEAHRAIPRRLLESAALMHRPAAGPPAPAAVPALPPPRPSSATRLRPGPAALRRAAPAVEPTGPEATEPAALRSDPIAPAVTTAPAGAAPAPEAARPADAAPTLDVPVAPLD